MHYRIFLAALTLSAAAHAEPLVQPAGDGLVGNIYSAGGDSAPRQKEADRDLSGYDTDYWEERAAEEERWDRQDRARDRYREQDRETDAYRRDRTIEQNWKDRRDDRKNDKR